MGLWPWTKRKKVEAVGQLMLVRAKFDAAQTTPDNRKHWANADYLSADAAGNPEVRDGKAMPKDIYVFCWPDGQQYVADWITHEFARLVKRAGIPHCTPHDLRRSFSTNAQRAGVDKYTVKDLGGWSVVSVVEKHYSGDVSEVHRAAMRRIAGTA